VRSGAVSVRTVRATGAADYLIVPPFAPGRDPFADRRPEALLIARRHRGGTVVASACLGSTLLAQSGILGGSEATTHWAWIERATERFPFVRWNAKKIICDSGNVITAGGFLAAVDLALFIVERTCSRSVARELGRLLLADSTRQSQSIYATSLVVARTDDPRMRRVETWLNDHLSSNVTAGEMAGVCGLGPRTFHREFVKAFGVTPKKFLQLKRVEKMRNLLRSPDISVEQAVERVGVRDVPSFRKVFQRELGLSPAAYRRRLRAEERSRTPQTPA
jgi:transcriptional regulator GlxA family with amidase domain